MLAETDLYWLVA